MRTGVINSSGARAHPEAFIDSSDAVLSVRED